jgi:LysM repeat protein
MVVKRGRKLDRASQTKLHKANLLVCMVVLVIISGYLISNHLFDSLANITGGRTAELVSYKISSGDTLWKLASQAVTPDEDVRDKIIAIQKANGIKASQALVPGQVIQIPVVKITGEDYRYTFNKR